MDEAEDIDVTPKPQAPSTPEEAEGPGVSLTRTEIRDIERAIKRRWVIPERAYQSIPEKLVSLVESTEKPRVIIAGTRALNAMLALNNDAAETGPSGPAIHMTIYNGQAPPDTAAENQISIPDNGRTEPQ